MHKIKDVKILGSSVVKTKRRLWGTDKKCLRIFGNQRDLNEKTTPTMCQEKRMDPCRVVDFCTPEVGG